MEVIFFDEKIETFITKLEKPTIAKILRTIDLLEHFGNKLGMPHSKNIEHQLFELRIRGTQEIRLIYTFYKERSIILHGFIKKSQKISKKELLISKQKLLLLDNI